MKTECPSALSDYPRLQVQPIKPATLLQFGEQMKIKKIKRSRTHVSGARAKGMQD